MAPRSEVEFPDGVGEGVIVGAVEDAVVIVGEGEDVLVGTVISGKEKHQKGAGKS